MARLLANYFGWMKIIPLTGAPPAGAIESFLRLFYFDSSLFPVGDYQETDSRGGAETRRISELNTSPPRLSVSASQRLSVSASQRLSVSASQRLSVSAGETPTESGEEPLFRMKVGVRQRAKSIFIPTNSCRGSCIGSLRSHPPPLSAPVPPGPQSCAPLAGCGHKPAR